MNRNWLAIVFIITMTVLSVLALKSKADERMPAPFNEMVSTCDDVNEYGMLVCVVEKEICFHVRDKTPDQFAALFGMVVFILQPAPIPNAMMIGITNARDTNLVWEVTLHDYRACLTAVGYLVGDGV